MDLLTAMRPILPSEKARIIELYKSGKSFSYIAQALHMGRSKVSLLCDVYIEQGLMERLDHSGFTGKKNHERYESNLNAAYELYKAGKTPGEVGKALGLSTNTALLYARELINRGRIQREQVNKGMRFGYGPGVVAAPTLEPGKTVNCTKAINSKCVYGELSEPHMCRYCLVTGKARTIETVDGRPQTGFCPPEACDKFSRVSRNNPRLEGRSYA